MPAEVAQLYDPPVAGVPLLAACVVERIFVPVAHVAEVPLPAALIFQLAGNVAMALLPIALKFCVAGVALFKLICAIEITGNKKKLNVKNLIKRKFIARA